MTEEQHAITGPDPEEAVRSSPPWLAALLAVGAGVLLITFSEQLGTTVRAERLLRFAGKLCVLLSLAVFVGHTLLMHVLGTRRTVRLYFRLSAVAVSCMFAIVIAEIGLRVVYRDVTTTADFTSWFSARYLRHYPPQQNSLGFREREFPATPTPGIYRIAVIGDSFAYGQGIAEAARFSNRVETLLNAAGLQCEVLNFGVPGAETKEQLETLRNVVVPAKPHAVLQQWFTNDVNGNATWAPPRPRRLVPSDVLAAELHRYSALYYVVNAQWTNWQYSTGIMPPAHVLTVERFTDTTGPAWTQAESRQRAMFETCREHQIDISMVLFPQLTESLGADYPLNFLLDRVASLSRDAGAPVVDLREPYAAIEPVASLWVNKFDWHPNAQANEIAAQQIMDALGPRWMTHAQSLQQP